MSTCSRLDLETLESQPNILKDFPKHQSTPINGAHMRAHVLKKSLIR